VGRGARGSTEGRVDDEHTSVSVSFTASTSASMCGVYSTIWSDACTHAHGRGVGNDTLRLVATTSSRVTLQVRSPSLHTSKAPAEVHDRDVGIPWMRTPAAGAQPFRAFDDGLWGGGGAGVGRRAMNMANRRPQAAARASAGGSIHHITTRSTSVEPGQLPSHYDSRNRVPLPTQVLSSVGL
jgi:hypothetical protein